MTTIHDKIPHHYKPLENNYKHLQALLKPSNTTLQQQQPTK
jgi:hypothetical protein